MYEASFTGFLETVLIILLIYYALKIIFRWFGPSIMNYFMKKMGEKVMGSFNQQANDFSSRKQSNEREVEINKNTKQTKKSNKEVGEYIDFEEID